MRPRRDDNRAGRGGLTVVDRHRIGVLVRRRYPLGLGVKPLPPPQLPARVQCHHPRFEVRLAAGQARLVVTGDVDRAGPAVDRNGEHTCTRRRAPPVAIVPAAGQPGGLAVPLEVVPGFQGRQVGDQFGLFRGLVVSDNGYGLAERRVPVSVEHCIQRPLALLDAPVAVGDLRQEVGLVPRAEVSAAPDLQQDSGVRQFVRRLGRGRTVPFAGFSAAVVVPVRPPALDDLVFPICRHPIHAHPVEPVRLADGVYDLAVSADVPRLGLHQPFPPDASTPEQFRGRRAEKVGVESRDEISGAIGLLTGRGVPRAGDVQVSGFRRTGRCGSLDEPHRLRAAAGQCSDGLYGLQVRTEVQDKRRHPGRGALGFLAAE